jgi:hypothetical protein
VIEGGGRRRAIGGLALGAGADRGRDHPAGQLGAGHQRRDGQRRAERDHVGPPAQRDLDRELGAADDRDPRAAVVDGAVGAAQQAQVAAPGQPRHQLLVEANHAVRQRPGGHRRDDQRRRQRQRAAPGAGRQRRQRATIGRQRGLERLDAGPAQRRHQRDRAADDRGQRRVDAVERDRRGRRLLGVEHRRDAADERRPPDDHLVQHQAQRVDVARRRRRLAAGLLGGHVARRAARRRLVGRDRRDAEVGEHDPPVARDQHVVGLEIAVDDADRVRGGQRVAQLDRDRHRQPDRQRPGAQAIGQRLAG